MSINKQTGKDLKELAIATQLLNKELGIEPEDIFANILNGISKVPDQLQTMVDSIVAMQKDFPMPEEGWNAFIRDLEYTNEKHGINLVIKEELLNASPNSSELE